MKRIGKAGGMDFDSPDVPEHVWGNGTVEVNALRLYFVRRKIGFASNPPPRRIFPNGATR